jgi:L-serine/L-threonine ammonia-lyase
VVSDADAVGACLALADDHRLVVEPACGAALAVATARTLPVLRDAAEVLIIVCGGVGASHAQLRAWAGTPAA